MVSKNLIHPTVHCTLYSVRTQRPKTTTSPLKQGGHRPPPSQPSPPPLQNKVEDCLTKFQNDLTPNNSSPFCQQRLWCRFPYCFRLSTAKDRCNNDEGGHCQFFIHKYSLVWTYESAALWLGGGNCWPSLTGNNLLSIVISLNPIVGHNGSWVR